MTFCTALNCIDGRTQTPVIEFLKKRFQVMYVDLITEPGVDGVLATGNDAAKTESVLRRCDVSLEKHDSVGIAVIGHFDCAGNPVEDEVHLNQIQQAVGQIQGRYQNVEVIGLWLDEEFRVHEVGRSQKSEGVPSRPS